ASPGQGDEGVDLVGERYGRPADRCGAKLVARRRRISLDANRQVLIIDGLPDLLRESLLPRIDPADRTLKLGEFEHHVGREVGLGQSPGRRRMVRLGWLRQRLLSDPRSER